jgi:Transglycosylase-like domain
MADCPRKLEKSYSQKYRQVANRHGTRAPGRNIRRYGMLVTWGRKGRHRVAFPAMCSELRRSRRQLVRLLTPPPVRWPAQLATAPVPPPQRPAGVSSAGTVASGAGGSSNAYVNPACESGGNSQVVSPNGMYWGKYQFDAQTWAAHGGDPGSYGSAPEAVQDQVAARVQYDAWPNC